MTKPNAIKNLIARPGRGQTEILILSTAFALAAAVLGGVYAAEHIAFPTILKILSIAIAVGLDVLALSIAVGIMHIPWQSRLRLGLSFSVAEVVMQLIGYAIGQGADHVIGPIASYVGFAVLAGVGAFIVRESYAMDKKPLNVGSVWTSLTVSLSVSLDSLGIGISLPGVPLPLMPLLVTVAVSTVLATAIGLIFGARLGEKYESAAERGAGWVLIALAGVFTVQHAMG